MAASIEEAVAAIREGRMVLAVDDLDRENEGDLIAAATHATPATVAAMLRHTTGVVCAALPAAWADRLRLPLMVADNRDPYRTAFTVTVDAVAGTTTGISASDRAVTLRALAAPTARPDDLTRPGHVFPLIAKDGGVLVRGGHTEASTDLVRLAGIDPAVAFICEVCDHDTFEMLRLPALLPLAAELGVPLISIADLQRYRFAREPLVAPISVDGAGDDGAGSVAVPRRWLMRGAVREEAAAPLRLDTGDATLPADEAVVAAVAAVGASPTLTASDDAASCGALSPSSTAASGLDGRPSPPALVDAAGTVSLMREERRRDSVAASDAGGQSLAVEASARFRSLYSGTSIAVSIFSPPGKAVAPPPLCSLTVVVESWLPGGSALAGEGSGILAAARAAAVRRVRSPHEKHCSAAVVILSGSSEDVAENVRGKAVAAHVGAAAAGAGDGLTAPAPQKLADRVTAELAQAISTTLAAAAAGAACGDVGIAAALPRGGSGAGTGATAPQHRAWTHVADLEVVVLPRREASAMITDLRARLATF